MSHYSRGANFERRVIKHLVEGGWYCLIVSLAAEHQCQAWLAWRDGNKLQMKEVTRGG